MHSVTNKSKCTGAVKKQLVRNINVPLQSTDDNRPRVHLHTSFARSNHTTGTSIKPIFGQTAIAEKYRKPELHSALTMARKIEKIKTAPVPAVKELRDLTPRSKTFVTDKATQRVNTRTDRTVFTDLVPVNVNDSVLELKCPPLRRRKSFTPMDRDPEPVLTDYLTPIEALTHHVRLEDMYPEGVEGLAAYIRPPYTDNHRDVCQLFEALNCEY